MPNEKSVPMSAIILAGGKSKRMGTDKAFLRYSGHTFISLITEQLLRISDDLVVAIGKKDRRTFESELVADKRLLLINDDPYIDNPLGGMLSAFGRVKNEYAFVTACDSPLPKLDVAKYLYNVARSHSAAVPVWEEDDVLTSEPLIAVYNVEQTKTAILHAMKRNMMGCKRILSLLTDTKYVSVKDLRNFDPTLTSLLNINIRQDYHRLEENCDIPRLSQSMFLPELKNDAASRDMSVIARAGDRLVG